MTDADVSVAPDGTSCVDADGDAAPGRGRADVDARRARHRRAARAPARRRARHPDDGHHVHRVLRRREHRPRLAVRHHPARDRRRRVGPHRARPRRSACARSTCSSTTSTTTSGSIADGVFPAELLDGSANYRPRVPRRAPEVRRVGAHLRHPTSCATPTATMYVLEDNLRVPSGVSYVLENRAVAKRAFAELFARAEHPPRRRLHRRAQQAAGRRSPPTASPTRRSSCSRRASTTRPTSSTRSSPSGWAPSWSRAPTSSSATTTACTCARSTGSSGST